MPNYIQIMVVMGQLPRSYHLFQESQPDPLGSVESIGVHEAGLGVYGSKDRVLPHWAAILITTGEIDYRDEQGARALARTGDLLFLSPNLGHTYRPRGEAPLGELWVTYSGKLFEVWFGHVFFKMRRCVLSLGRVEPWRSRLIALAKAEAGTAFARASRWQTWLAEAFAEVERGRFTPEERQWMQASQELLKTAHSPAEVAEQMGESYQRWRKRFQRLHGLPPARYQARSKIQLAAEQMWRNGLSNKQLAELHGFSSEFHFSQRFRQIMGRCPRDYRAQMK